jgi:hypothetical protein
MYSINTIKGKTGIRYLGPQAVQRLQATGLIPNINPVGNNYVVSTLQQ